MKGISTSLIDLAQGKALLRPSDAVAQGHSRLYLAQLAQRRLVHKVSRRLYALPQRKASEFSSLAEVASKYPQAVVWLCCCLRCGWPMQRWRLGRCRGEIVRGLAARRRL
jgi:hypothetical protein